jgi:16S rRNA (cytosine967-C5)-methyltransferase
MNRFHAYLQHARRLIDRYEPGSPLAFLLKSYFKSNPILGSRDRKSISALTYAHFRCRHCLSDSLDANEQLLIALFLTSSTPHPILQALKPEWELVAHLSLDEKWNHLQLGMQRSTPSWISFLSPEIEPLAFADALFQQPFVFIRLRPGKKQKMKDMLELVGIPFMVVDENTFAFEQGVSLNKWPGVDRDFVVQDLSSQRVFSALNAIPEGASVWDCCAASGGKSILFHDVVQSRIKLTVSDVRKPMLQNLKARLSAAGISLNRLFSTDLTTHSGLPKDERFNVVLCDVPCSGSGTWARTPEQMLGFDEAKLNQQVSRQRAILDQVVPHMQTNGQLIYITCSVFAQENEMQVQYLKQKHGLDCISMHYYRGYTERADTLFAAILQKPIKD